MLIAEIYKKWLREDYNGDYKRMIADGQVLLIDEDFVRRAHNAGHGTMKDLKISMENNAVYCKWYDMENHRFITAKDIKA